jgi:hypothetical protein
MTVCDLVNLLIPHLSKQVFLADWVTWDEDDTPDIGLVITEDCVVVTCRLEGDPVVMDGVQPSSLDAQARREIEALGEQG